MHTLYLLKLKNKAEYLITEQLLFDEIDLSVSYFILFTNQSKLSKTKQLLKLEYTDDNSRISAQQLDYAIADLQFKKQNNPERGIIGITKGIQAKNVSLTTQDSIVYILTFNDKTKIGQCRGFNLENTIKNLQNILKETVDESLSAIIKVENSEKAKSIVLGLFQDFQEFTMSESETNIWLDKSIAEKVIKLIEIKKEFLPAKGITDISVGINFILSTQKTQSWDETTETKEILGQNMTSREVCDALKISLQTLKNWRESGLIKFSKISERKFLYASSEIEHIKKYGIRKKPVINTSENLTVFTDDSADYRAKIIEWLNAKKYLIDRETAKKLNVFLNFGNVKLKSSPLVMITNDYLLKDMLYNRIIINNQKDVYDYLVQLTKDKAEPKIDYSDKLVQECSETYLSRLRNKEQYDRI